MQPILQCNGITKRYGPKIALDNIHLAVNSGRIVGLLGPNGSGKSTMMKLINGLLTPDHGQVLIAGKPPSVESRRRIAYLPERTYLNDWMRMKDMIAFFSDFYEDFRPEVAYDMLERLHINPTQPLKSMSKGTKEKVQLILVMSRKADLYLLDEPIGGVDPAARDYILNTIVANYNEQATILISTHLISDVEPILDDVIFINQGRVLVSASVEEIREQEGKSVDAYFREVFRC